MPESATAPVDFAALSSSELHSVEPKDKRTKEHALWRAALDGAIEREMTVLPPGSPAPSAPPAPNAPSPAPSAAPAAKVYPEPKTLLSPDEFIANFVQNEPAAVLRFGDEPNPAAAFASAIEKAFTGYLILVSPRFRAHYQRRIDTGEVAKQFLPRSGILHDLHDIALGK